VFTDSQLGVNNDSEYIVLESVGRGGWVEEVTDALASYAGMGHDLEVLPDDLDVFLGLHRQLPCGRQDQRLWPARSRTIESAPNSQHVFWGGQHIPDLLCKQTVAPHILSFKEESYTAL